VLTTCDQDSPSIILHYINCCEETVFKINVYCFCPPQSTRSPLPPEKSSSQHYTNLTRYLQKFQLPAYWHNTAEYYHFMNGLYCLAMLSLVIQHFAFCWWLIHHKLTWNAQNTLTLKFVFVYFVWDFLITSIRFVLLYSGLQSKCPPFTFLDQCQNVFKKCCTTLLNFETWQSKNSNQVI